MATSPSFNWPEPDNSDLVKNGALAIRTAVDAIDASMTDLKGGTTGQVLSKTSNTDMDFTWVAQDDSNAIQNAIVDAKGDLIAATAADTPARLAVGSNGQVLTADSTAATGIKWATPASSSKYVLLNQTTMSAVSSQTIDSVMSTSYNSYVIVLDSLIVAAGTASVSMQLMYSGTADTSSYFQGSGTIAYNGTSVGFNNVSNGSAWSPIQAVGTSGTLTTGGIIKVVYSGGSPVPIMDFQTWNAYNTFAVWGGGINHNSRTFTGFKFIPSSSTLSGRISIYGVAN